MWSQWGHKWFESAMTFGGSFFAAPTAIAVFSRKALPAVAME
jgi:hypothetical protein